MHTIKGLRQGGVSDWNVHEGKKDHGATERYFDENAWKDKERKVVTVQKKKTKERFEKRKEELFDEKEKGGGGKANVYQSEIKIESEKLAGEEKEGNVHSEKGEEI